MEGTPTLSEPFRVFQWSLDEVMAGPSLDSSPYRIYVILTKLFELVTSLIKTWWL